MTQRDDAFPHYHFRPPANWINDPNGVVQWNGRYHLFYQHNPNGALWGNPHWGHAVSDDLVHWQQLPLALSPTEGEFDEFGCFSGCLVDNDGIPTIIYTGCQAEPTNGMPFTQHANVAFGSDDLVTWRKYKHNPVIRASADYQNLVGFRDHCVWREGGEWLQLIGSGIKGAGGILFLYRSADLLNWEYLHPFWQLEQPCFGKMQFGAMWECPQLLHFGNCHVIVISISDELAMAQTVYVIGRYDNHYFHPNQAYVLDYGNRYFYAPQATVDANGRTLMWGWIPEGRPDNAAIAAGWSGVLSLPRVVTMGDDNRLHFAPAAELRALRVKLYLADQLDDVQSDHYEIEAEFAPQERIAIHIRVAADGRERTTIFYDPQRGNLGIDRHQSCRDAHGYDLSLLEGDVALSAEGRLHLHIYVDASVIEVFANKVAVITGRIYPHADSLGIELEATEQAVCYFNLWTLKGVNSGFM